MKWGKVKLGDYCEIASSKRVFYSDYVSSGVPFYRSKEIIQKHSHQDIDEPLYITQRKYDEILEKFGVPQPGDMLLTSVGTIGTPYVVKDTDYFYFKDGNLTWFRNFTDNLLSDFLYYWIQSHDGKGALNALTIGSSQKALTIASLKGLEIPLPPLPDQRRITDMLSAYDDLIVNNQKQIKLLEEAAMRLYKEWFVNLRFPGHGNTPIVDGMPDGWRVVKLGDISDFKYGKMPKKEKIKNSGYPLFSGYGVVGYYDEFMFANEMLIVVARGVGGTGDVKFSPHHSYLTNLSIIFLLQQEKYKYFLFQQYQFRNLRELDTGAAQSQITIENLSRHKTILPSHEVIDSFNCFFEPIHNKVLNHKQNISTLKNARDKLLPKLMSGEIEV